MNKATNYDRVGQFEHPGTSATAVLCHGGFLDGDEFDPCAMRGACERLTPTPALKRRLPIHQ